MNSVGDIASRPSSGGFRWLIWIGLLAAAFLAVWLVMMGVAPVPSALAPWIYPGSRAVSPSNALPFECRVFATTDHFAAVNRWYSERAGTGSGDPAFVMRGSPFGGPVTGMKVSLVSNEFVRASLHCQRTLQGLTAALVSHAPGEPAVSVTVLAVREALSPPMPAAAHDLAYPGAKRGSGGVAGTSSGFQFTSTNSVDNIFSHYLSHFGVVPGVTQSSGLTWNAGPTNAPNSLSLLPLPARSGMDERTLFIRTTTNICLVHFARATNALATEMIVTIVPR